jgi:RNA polymerase sigma factor (sigma-70 family)
MGPGQLRKGYGAAVPDQPRDRPAPGTGERFEAFYLREFPAMVKLAYALSGSRLAAEEIAQEAFLAAYRDWQRVAWLDQPAGWVRKVVVRIAGRTVHRRVLEAKAYARLRVGRPPGFVEPPATDAEVWRAVRALPKGQAQAIALHYVADYSVAQVAQTLGLSEGTVKQQLHRGRQALASRLGSSTEADR